MSETLILSPDRATYWRAHLIMAVVLGAGAGLVLLVVGNPYPVMGPVGAGLAIAARAGFVASEAMAERWVLSDTHLTGPMERNLPLRTIRLARRAMGAVQVVTQDGNKHLIKYLADPDAAVRAITAAVARAQGTTA